jgi:SUMO ligase MMS21 Smc5/6 complex component
MCANLESNELVKLSKKMFEEENKKNIENNDEDLDLVVESTQNILATCPLGRVPITKAVKSKKCGHHFEHSIVYGLLNQRDSVKCHCGSSFTKGDITLSPDLQKEIDAAAKKSKKSRRDRN